MRTTWSPLRRLSWLWGLVLPASAEVIGRLAQEQVLPTDLPSITARYGTIDSRIQSLKTEFVNLQTVVQQVKTEANSTGARLASSETMLTGALSLAQQKNATVVSLAAQLEGEVATIRRAAEDMKILKGTLAFVEQTALTLDQRVGALNTTVQELLPGKDFLPGRILRAHEKLQTYQANVDSGSLDPIVATSLRSKFLRAQRRTEDLAEDELQKKLLEEEGADDEDGGSGSDAASA